MPMRRLSRIFVHLASMLRPEIARAMATQSKPLEIYTFVHAEGSWAWAVVSRQEGPRYMDFGYVSESSAYAACCEHLLEHFSRNG